MTDHDRVTELFRDAAASDVPAGFDLDDVRSASRRVTLRRRSALLGGAAALLLVGALGTAVLVPPERDGTATTAAAPGPESGTGSGTEADDAGPAGAAPPAAPPTAPPSLRIAPEPAIGAPLGPGTGPCADRQDPALRALVQDVLPEVAGAREAATTDECLPGGQRGLALEIDGQLLAVTYLPPGQPAPRLPGAVGATTASGGTVVVSTSGALAGRAGDLLGFLAPRL